MPLLKDILRRAVKEMEIDALVLLSVGDHCLHGFARRNLYSGPPIVIGGLLGEENRLCYAFEACLSDKGTLDVEHFETRIAHFAETMPSLTLRGIYASSAVVSSLHPSLTQKLALNFEVSILLTVIMSPPMATATPTPAIIDLYTRDTFSWKLTPWKPRVVGAAAKALRMLADTNVLYPPFTAIFDGAGAEQAWATEVRRSREEDRIDVSTKREKKKIGAYAANQTVDKLLASLVIRGAAVDKSCVRLLELKEELESWSVAGEALSRQIMRVATDLHLRSAVQLAQVVSACGTYLTEASNEEAPNLTDQEQTARDLEHYAFFQTDMLSVLSVIVQQQQIAAKPDSVFG